jgi:hypothetical protein
LNYNDTNSDSESDIDEKVDGDSDGAGIPHTLNSEKKSEKSNIGAIVNEFKRCAYYNGCRNFVQGQTLLCNEHALEAAQLRGERARLYAVVCLSLYF